MPRYNDDYGWYTSSGPRPAKDGIKAKTARGAFGTSWWAKRWIGVLETFNWGSRLERGRSYARRGQVLDIDIAAGHVNARVQGSQVTPYSVMIAMPPLDDSAWERAIDSMAQQAIFMAQLLAGEMPQEIEEAFIAASVPLFPQQAHDIDMTCSCPDYATPCKHIAAVYYLLGERFDADPFLLFELRGRTREQITAALRARRASTVAVTNEPISPAEPVPALADLLDTFYQPSVALDTISIEIAAPEIQAAVLRRLGPAPAGTDADLRGVYKAMTRYALDKAFGDHEQQREG